MARTLIADEHHVARHVRGRLVQEVDGKIVGCFPQAFELRPATETRPAEQYLSASWLEFFSGDRVDRIRETLRELRGYLTVKGKDAFAILNVGKTKELGLIRNMKMRVWHEPKLPQAPAYAAIRGMRRDDAEILSLLAAEGISEIVQVLQVESGAL